MIVLSPAKSLRENHVSAHKSSDLIFPDESQSLIKTLREFSQDQLQDLMSISEPLAELNYDRYQSYDYPFDKKSTNTAIHSFTGDVYQGLEADSWSGHDLNFAQKRLRILSGLYGLLRPLDLMHPYRLEMGTKLATQKGKNLYEFWGDQITKRLNEDIEQSESKFLLNLASNEYWKAVNPALIQAPVYTIHFRERRKGRWAFVSFNAKKARGIMASYVILNRIKSINKIKHFAEANYKYNPDLSKKNEWFFTREEI